MTSYQTIHVVSDQAVGIVTLARPAQRNALNPTMFDELSVAVAAIAANQDVRALVLHGDGGHFCAGADLDEGFSPPSGRTSSAPAGPRPDPFSALRECPIPTFAAIEGAAVGIGLSLALSCDMVVVGRSARLQLAQVRVALVPDGGASWALARLVGPQRAAWLALSGASVGGDEAAGMGLAVESVADGEALSAVLDRARRIAATSRPVLERVKRVLRTGEQGGWAGAFAAERAALKDAYTSPEFEEALRRMRDRRGGTGG